MSKKLIFIIPGIIILLLAGIFVFISLTSTDLPSTDEITKYPTMPTDEIQYLIFAITAEGVHGASPEEMFKIIDKDVADVINQIGTTGDKKSRQLGFLIIVPPWIVESVVPDKWPLLVKEAFKVAKKRNVAAYFSIESHYAWEPRSDLYKDPQNVEWADWDGTPYPTRYVTWMVPINTGVPHMCYNSPKIKSEVARLAKDFIAPPIQREINELKKTGQEYLFAGITVSSEPMIDNYAALDKLNPNIGALIARDGNQKARLGYCALTNAGYSKSNPPKDFGEALAKVNQEFIALWAKGLTEGGISSSKLYNHVPASDDKIVLEFTNAPPWIAFNEYSRPGWSAYPDRDLAKNFDILYKELEKHGNPHWGGTETAPAVDGDPEEFLRRFFDHGASVVVINAGDPDLSTELFGTWGEKEIVAYRKFLKGEKLVE